MEEEQNKSEKPTQYKLQQAKEKGQVAKSTEFNAVFMMLFFLLITYVFSDGLMSSIKIIATGLFKVSHDISGQPTVLITLVVDTFLKALFAVLPFLFVLMLLAIVSNLSQIGVIFTTFTLKPDITKLNPAKNIKNIFSGKTLFELFKSLLKITLFSVFIYVSADYVIAQLVPLAITSSHQMTSVWYRLFYQLALWVVLILAFTALIDFAFTKWTFNKKMMMSKHELKQEYKKKEGDPEIKSKRKQAQQELLKKSASLSNVKDADIVVTNPTHIAIALKYDSETMVSPKVMAMGKGDLALKIRTLARRHQVPVVQNKMLARQLYKECKLNGNLPLNCYKAVASLFRWLLAVKEQAKNG